MRRVCRNHRRRAGSPAKPYRGQSEALGMKTFDYIKPATASEAAAAAAQPGTAYLAGGTNLLDLMKGGIARPDRLVDVAQLPGLARIEHRAEGGLRIGALVRNATLCAEFGFVKA